MAVDERPAATATRVAQRIVDRSLVGATTSVARIAIVAAIGSAVARTVLRFSQLRATVLGPAAPASSSTDGSAEGPKAVGLVVSVTSVYYRPIVESQQSLSDRSN